MLEKEKPEAHAFIQGAVYCWCNTNQSTAFAARHLFGGDNWHWGGTPLMPIYEHYLENYQMEKNEDPEDSAFKAAGIDAGHLLKHVLHEDRRNFSWEEKDQVKYYTWVHP